MDFGDKSAMIVKCMFCTRTASKWSRAMQTVDSKHPMA